MSEKVLDVTVTDLPTKDDLRDAVYEEFDVDRDGPVAGAVFGDADRAPGSQNTLQHNGAAQPKHLAEAGKNQVPAQVMAIYGPVDGAILLADSWIAHGEDISGDLAGWQKRTLIDQAVEKYGFNMTVAEAAAVKALEDETGRAEERRTLEETLADESDNVDARFESGETLQTKAGRAKYEGCDLKASVEEEDDGLRVRVWEK
jgi:hypothetical protein